MKIDIKDLLRSVLAIGSQRARIGLPDDPTMVDIADPQLLTDCLDNALCAFRELRGGDDYLVSAEVNTYHQQVWVRFVLGSPCEDRNGQVEPALQPSFRTLIDTLQQSRGELHYWGGNNYFDVSFPFHGPIREAFPEVKHLAWEERYRFFLERASWESLRDTVFRFSDLAERFAARCDEFKLSKVLIPSVGLCVHPWLFADLGLTVVATDIAGSALTTLSEPERCPRLYSRAAFERWDIAESASYASLGNPTHFERMPDLKNQSVRKSLRQRITFAQSDWIKVPLSDGSVDAIFATNALPRESSAEQIQVLQEWIRVVRPGGLVLIVQHNFFDSNIETILREAGWVEANILDGDRPAQTAAVGYQMRFSSG